MPVKRADRVAQLIQEEISRLILRSVKDPRIGFVTVTHVSVSDDLRHAKVYLSLAQADDEAQRRDALVGMRSAAGFLRGELTRRLRLRYAPALAFYLDDSLERELKLAELLRQIDTEKTTEL
ncbi:MAG: 30S ribosome-binding factor RbfA [Candidatus Methylomirabilaceae bacterium]